MDSTWSNPNFLQQSSDEYLASLQNFLDGQDSSFTANSFDPSSGVNAFAHSPQNGNPGGAFATPGKAGAPTFDAFSAALNGGSGASFSPSSDIQINPSLLGSLDGYNGLGTLNTALDASSPELTSASSSGDSPASSTDGPAPPQQTIATRGQAGNNRRVVSGGSNSEYGAAGGVGANAGHDKRKAPQQGNGSVKDRKSVGDSGLSGSTYHSHPTGEDGEFERSESPELPAGKGSKGKTSERRRAQNRQAQRNFRERKEKHLKDLETRVLELESQTQNQDSENSALKALLEQLRSENARLRVFETAFTFNYNKDVDGSAAMPQATQFGGAGLPSLPQGGARPHSQRSGSSQLPSPTSSFSDKPPASPKAQDENPAFKFGTSSLDFGLSSAAPTSSELNAQQLFTASPISTPPSAATSTSAADDLFASFTLPSPPSLSSSSAAAPSISSNLSPSPYPTAQLTSYRDPLPALLGSTTAAQPGLTTFADLDLLFGVTPSSGTGAGYGVSPGVGGLGNEDPLASFLASSTSSSLGTSASPSATAALASPSTVLPLGASPSMFPPSSASPAASASASAGSSTKGPEELAVCGRIREAQQQAVQRGEKFEFDLDGLCSEMKLKATCQEAARQALKSAMAEDAAASRMSYPGRQI
ncbi:hypothetical protein JCM11251_005764 [Rhodosporidiobolus azoricus]